MKRQTRTTKQIIKAVSVGLSASMLLQPVTAMADGLDENAPVLPDVEEKEEVPYVNAADEDAASENKEALENAAELIDDAIDKEDATEHAAEELQRATVDPLEKGTISAIENTEDNDNHLIVPAFPFIIDFGDQKDSAEEYETSAGEKVDEAQNILDEAEKELTGDPEAEEEADKTGVLDKFEGKIQASEGYSYESVKEAAQAAADMLTADAASVSANEATSSAEAREYAEVAKQASEEAAQMSVSANENAANALDEYNEASKLLEQAKKIAKDANAEAEKKIKAGYEDAKEAVKKAKEAEEYAEGLEKYVGLKKAAADAYVESLNQEIIDITNEINSLTQEINGYNWAKGWAERDLKFATDNLNDKLDKLAKAQADMAKVPSMWSIWGMEGQLARLKEAKENAELNLGILYKAYIDSGVDSWEAQQALKKVEKSYNKIKDQYNEAVATVKNSGEEKTVLEGTVTELKTQYGDDIMNKQDALRNAKADKKADAAKELIQYVMGGDGVTVISYEGIPNGIFMVKNGEAATYYTYEIAKDGTITIKNCTYEVIQGTTKAVEAEIASNLSESQKDALVKSLADGSFFVKGDDSETFMVTYKPFKIKGAKAYTTINGVQCEVECDYSDDYWDDNLYWWAYINGSWKHIRSENVYRIAASGLTSEAADEYVKKAWFDCAKVSQGTATVYTVTSNVDSKVITEAELAGGEWLHYEKVSDAVEGTDAVYKLVADNGVPVNHNRFCDVAPETTGKITADRVIAKEYIYDYSYELNGKKYTISNGDLRWNEENQVWEVYGYKKFKSDPLEWKSLMDITSNNRTVVVANKHKVLENLTKEQAEAYGYGTVVEVSPATDAKPATYRVYYNKTTTTPDSVSATVDSDALALSNIAKQLADLQDKIDKAQGVVSKNQKTVDAYNAALKDAEDKKAKYEKAEGEYWAAVSNYNNEHYFSRIAKLEKDLSDAKKDFKDAKDKLDSAYADFLWASAGHGIAFARLAGINYKLNTLDAQKTAKLNEKAGLSDQLKSAQALASYYKDRLEAAADLEDKAEAARIAAEKARDALKLLRGTSNVGAQAIRKAEEELSIAWNQYLDAKKLAELSKEDAEKAKESYNKILERIDQLLEEEAARGGEDDEDEGEETTTTTPAPGTILVAQAGPAVVIPATATAAAGAPEDTASEETVDNTTQQTITENLVPMAAAPTEQIINEQDVPLAPMDEQAKMSWWWIIAVLVLGTTGAELLRRRMVKKNTATLESTKTNK